jgi:hypothetical protein
VVSPSKATKSAKKKARQFTGTKPRNTVEFPAKLPLKHGVNIGTLLAVDYDLSRPGAVGSRFTHRVAGNVPVYVDPAGFTELVVKGQTPTRGVTATGIKGYRRNGVHGGRVARLVIVQAGDGRRREFTYSGEERPFLGTDPSGKTVTLLFTATAWKRIPAPSRVSFQIRARSPVVDGRGHHW